MLKPELLITRLGDVLVEQGLITSNQLSTALEVQKQQKAQGISSLLGQIMIQLEFIDQEKLDQAITQQILKLQNSLIEANANLEKRVRERTIELEEANRKLSALNEMKSNFVSNISHELQTPITHIIGYLDLIQETGSDNLSREQKESLKVIKRASLRLEHLIEDLILFSTSKAGNLSLEKEDFDIVPLVNETIAKIEPVGANKKIRIFSSYPQKAVIVHADRHKIQWVLNHLLENAVKFTPEGGKVTASIEQHTDQVKISINDTGIGIAPEKIEEIFEPFHQLDGSSTRQQGGTGLGLTLARKILEAHKIKITVESIPGEGSTFSFMMRCVANNE